MQSFQMPCKQIATRRISKYRAGLFSLIIPQITYQSVEKNSPVAGGQPVGLDQLKPVDREGTWNIY